MIKMGYSRDAHGHLINKQGKLINMKGQLIDRDGNLLEQDSLSQGDLDSETSLKMKEDSKAQTDEMRLHQMAKARFILNQETDYLQP